MATRETGSCAQGRRSGKHHAPGYSFECEVLQLPRARGSAPRPRPLWESDASRVARLKFGEQSRLASAFALHSPERPDKHGRRELRRLRGRD